MARRTVREFDEGSPVTTKARTRVGAGSSYRRRDLERTQRTQSANALVSAINASGGLVAPAFITWTLFATFAAITAASTTDLQILMDGPISVPLLPNVQLPHSFYYAVASWFLVALHLHLLIHLDHIADKLRRLRKTDPQSSGHRAAEIAGIPLVQWAAHRESGMGSYWANQVQVAVVWISLVAAPISIQLLHQSAFLPFQSVAITWNQRVALIFHACTILFYWHRLTITDPFRSSHQRSIRAALIGLRRTLPHVVFVWTPIMVAVLLSLVVLTIPDEGWERVLESVGVSRQNSDAVLRSLQPSSRLSIRNMQPPDSSEAPWDCRLLAVPSRYVKLDLSIPRGLKTSCLTAAFLHSHGAFHRTLDILPPANVQPPQACTRMDDQKPRPASGPLQAFGRSLRYASLPGFDLSSADLRMAALVGSNFESARMTGTLLQGTDLSTALLRHADLSGSILYGADLSEADLSQADLRGARISRGTIFSNDYPEEARFGGKNLEAPTLKNAILAGANLQGQNLSYADCTGCVFAGADLTGVVAIGTTLVDASFVNATMDGSVLVSARLDRSSLYSASLVGANLDNATLSIAILARANLTGASIRNVDMTLADLTGAKLVGADMHSDSMRGDFFNASSMKAADLGGTDLRGADLTDVDTTFVLADPKTRTGIWTPDIAKQAADWENSKFLSMRDAGQRLSVLRSASTRGLKRTVCVGPLSICPDRVDAQIAAAKAYATYLGDNICGHASEPVGLASASRLIAGLFGGEADVLRPAMSHYPATSTGTEWPGFKSALLSEAERLPSSKCKTPIPVPWLKRIAEGRLFMESNGRAEITEPGYRISNAEYAYHIRMSQRYAPER